MAKLLARYLQLNIWVQAVWWLCLVGAAVNAVLASRDLMYDGVLLKLHVGFLLLYAGQVVFISLEERQVWALAALQGVMALLTNADFTCMPLVRFVGHLVYVLGPEPSLEYVKVYRYVLISAAFTLQMLSAFILFSLLPKNASPAPLAEDTADHLKA